jgi:phosphate-selective porin OprO/OprP
VKGGTAFDRDIKAWYADINWLVTGESWADAYKSGVFGRISPKRNFDDKDGWGALELGLRYSQYDGSDFRNLIASATANASEAGAWTVGAKWILNPNARILLNYVRTDFNEPTKLTVNGKTEDKEQAIVLRGQYDF